MVKFLVLINFGTLIWGGLIPFEDFSWSCEICLSRKNHVWVLVYPFVENSMPDACITDAELDRTSGGFRAFVTICNLLDCGFHLRKYCFVLPRRGVTGVEATKI